MSDCKVIPFRRPLRPLAKCAYPMPQQGLWVTALRDGGFVIGCGRDGSSVEQRVSRDELERFHASLGEMLRGGS